MPRTKSTSLVVGPLLFYLDSTEPLRAVKFARPAALGAVIAGGGGLLLPHPSA